MTTGIGWADMAFAESATRIDAIREVTRKFIEGRPNDRIGIIAFAGRPYVVSPMTLDHDWLLKNLERVKIGLVEDGTAILKGTEVVVTRYERGIAYVRPWSEMAGEENELGETVNDRDGRAL